MKLSKKSFKDDKKGVDNMDEPKSKMTEWIEKIKEKYPSEYEKINYNLQNYNQISSNKPNRVNQIIAIIRRYSYFSLMTQYDIDESYINTNKIYEDYYNEISQNIDDFTFDLIQLFHLDYINLFNWDDKTKKLFIGNEYHGQFMKDENYFYYFIEKLCIMIHSINKNHLSAQVIIYFTALGDKYQRENLPYYLVQTALQDQKELKNSQISITKRMDSYSKEIISIVAIILTIVPIIAINITGLQKIELKELLATNGCIITAIVSVIFCINVSFFQLNKRHWFLLIPALIGLALIAIPIFFLK
jgi:hypothetical protein